MTECYLIRCTPVSFFKYLSLSLFRWAGFLVLIDLSCWWQLVPLANSSLLWAIIIIILYLNFIIILYWQSLYIFCFPIIFFWAESYPGLLDLFVFVPGAARFSPSRPSTAHSKDGRQTPMRATPSSGGSRWGSYLTEKNLFLWSNIYFLFWVLESTNQISCMHIKSNKWLSFWWEGKNRVYMKRTSLTTQENQQTQLGIEARFNSRLDHCDPHLLLKCLKSFFLFCFRCTSSLSDHLDSMNDKLTALEIDRIADHLRWKSSCPLQMHKFYWIKCLFALNVSQPLFSHDEDNASPRIQLFIQDTCEFVTISWALYGCHQTITTTNKLPVPGCSKHG